MVNMPRLLFWGLEEIGRGVSAEHHMKGLWGLGPRDGARGGGGERVWNVSCCSEEEDWEWRKNGASYDSLVLVVRYSAG